MKFLVLLITLIVPLLTYGQDTLYFKKNQKEPLSNDIDSFDFYQVIHQDSESDLAMIREYNKNHTIQKVRRYSSLEERQKAGKQEYYRKDGTLKWIEHYENDQKNGILESYWPNGNTKRQDLYQKGEFVEGKCFDANREEVPYYEFEVMPEYIGGPQKMIRDLYGHLKYPKIARENNMQGEVVVKFTIDESGKPIRHVVVKSAGAVLDREALRCIKLLKKWKPGMQDGQAVKVQFALPVNFRFE